MKKNFGDNDILLKRLLVTLGVLLVTRLGTFLPIPGINQEYLFFYIQNHSVTRSLVTAFSGDTTFVLGLFDLNIFPFINASILMQVLFNIVPKLEILQKEGSMESKRKINRITRILTLACAIIQSVSIASSLKRVLFDWNLFLAIEIIIWLTTGGMIVLWLSELITVYGLGNGASLLVYTNIISTLPILIKRLLLESDQSVSFVSWLIISFLLFITIYGIVMLQEAARIIPLISSKQLGQASTTFSLFLGNDYSDNYIPLRFNQAGVMPIILTTSVLVAPNSIGQLGILSSPIFKPPAVLIQSSIALYWLSYFILVILFSSFYSTIVVNPKDISDELQKMAVAVPGIRPGVETRFYLEQVMRRITSLGAIMLAIVVTVPNIIEVMLPIPNLNGLGSTSLVISVGVILELSREIRSILLSNIYTSVF